MKRTFRFVLLTIVGLVLGFYLHGFNPLSATSNRGPIATEILAIQQIQQGQDHYRAGQFAAAIASFEQAINQLQQQGAGLQEAQALSLLSLAQQKLGSWQAASQSLDRGLARVEQLRQTHKQNYDDRTYDRTHAQLLNAQGQMQFDSGQPEAAVQSWQQAQALYAQADYQPGVLGCQINQAQALQVLGLYRRAEFLYRQLQESLEAQPDSQLKAIGLNNLGNTLRQVADLEEAETVLLDGLAVSQRLGLATQEQQLLLSLGHVQRAVAQRAQVLADRTAQQEATQKAWDYYQQVNGTNQSSLSDPLLQLQAQLSLLHLLLDMGQLDAQKTAQVETLVIELEDSIEALPLSRAVVDATIDFVQQLQLLYRDYDIGVGVDGNALVSEQTILTWLNQGVQQASELDDLQAQSYALGNLGHWYEQQEDWQAAVNVTQHALAKAQEIRAPELTYQWQWQMGRVLKSHPQSTFTTASYVADLGDHPGNEQPGDNPQEAALNYYDAAYETLRSLRGELIALNPEVQFSFRERVEPVYREYVDLLLSQESPDQDALMRARNVIEGLQLAELDNFFQEACVTAEPRQIDAIDPKAAVFYPIILPSRLAVIVSIPDRPLIYHQTPLPQFRVEGVLNQMLEAINPAFPAGFGLQTQQLVYDWLIRSFEPQLQENAIETLVFVLDGALRNLPMTALHNGEQYLIENYNVALTPGLQLLPSNLISLTQLKLLAVGLTEARPGFTPLPAVGPELEGITTLQETAYVSEARKLLNEEFTTARLKEQIEQFPAPIVHLATHGQFSSNPEQTFILTWDGTIQAKDFQELLQPANADQTSAIDLLVLSACETAAGDQRAALGLAGLAVRSGARSTLATLWPVNDVSTGALMVDFYDKLIQQQLSKAEALQQAQVALLQTAEYNHPFYWAPFVLVGNWL